MRTDAVAEPRSVQQITEQIVLTSAELEQLRAVEVERESMCRQIRGERNRAEVELRNLHDELTRTLGLEQGPSKRTGGSDG